MYHRIHGICIICITARTRIRNMFCPKCAPIPLGHCVAAVASSDDALQLRAL